MNFIGISIVVSAVISLTMGYLGANYTKPVPARSEVPASQLG